MCTLKITLWDRPVKGNGDKKRRRWKAGAIGGETYCHSRLTGNRPDWMYAVFTNFKVWPTKFRSPSMHLSPNFAFAPISARCPPPPPPSILHPFRLTIVSLSIVVWMCVWPTDLQFNFLTLYFLELSSSPPQPPCVSFFFLAFSFLFD